MAIQLNDRDYLIFKLLEEHQVLLEKHISWFVASQDKPVLIRDRLRKLFYLDYLLCQRHDSRLAWWTTPTKPLVYMLAPLARTVSGGSQIANDIYDNEWQRNHLEIANIRMIFLIAQKEGILKALNWKTHLPTADKSPLYDAVISCTWDSYSCTIGLISHPELNTDLTARLCQALDNTENAYSMNQPMSQTMSQTMTHTMIISRNQSHQESLQKAILVLPKKTNVNSILLATHQDLYKSGLSKVSWRNALGQKVTLPNIDSSAAWGADFGTMKAASA